MPNNSEVVPVVGAEVLHEEMTPVQLEHKAVCTPHKFNPVGPLLFVLTYAGS